MTCLQAPSPLVGEVDEIGFVDFVWGWGVAESRRKIER